MRLAVDVEDTSEAAPAPSRAGQGLAEGLMAAGRLRNTGAGGGIQCECSKTTTGDPMFLLVSVEKVSMTSNLPHRHHRGPLSLTSAVLHEVPHAETADRGQASLRSNVQLGEFIHCWHRLDCDTDHGRPRTQNPLRGRLLSP